MAQPRAQISDAGLGGFPTTISGARYFAGMLGRSEGGSVVVKDWPKSMMQISLLRKLVVEEQKFKGATMYSGPRGPGASGLPASSSE